MVTQLNKQEIYNLLKDKFNFDEPYALAEVGKEMTASGHGCRRYGYARMKNFMKELKEFIQLEDYKYDGHSNTNVFIKKWENKSEVMVGNVLWTTTSAEMAESENELGAGLLHIKRNKIKDQSKDIKKTLKPPVVTDEDSEKVHKPLFDEIEKAKVYQILCGKFPKNEKLHMAKISKYLTERGFAPKSYGYSKMKSMLQEMKQYVELEDVIIHNVPNVLVTLIDSAKSKPKLKRKENTEEQSIEVKNIETVDEKVTEKAVEVFEKGKVGEFLRLAYLPPKIVDILKRKGFRNPDRVLASAYQHALCHQLLQEKNHSITFPVKCGEENLLAVLKKNDKPNGRQWYVSFVGVPADELEDEEREDDLAIPPGKSLEQFADLGSWQDFLKELAELALPERWDSDQKRYGRYYVLRKYIQYTFYRLLQEEKICISHDRKFAAFNTGLVNHHYDDIYACFVQSSQKDKGEWKFEAFAIAGVRGKDGYGKLLTNYFNPLPQVPKYVEKKEDLIYDLDKELLTDYEHIIVDNLRRLPKGYLVEGCYGDDRAMKMIAELSKMQNGTEKQNQAYTELSRYIAGNDRVFRRLRSRMEDAIEIALKRVRWNFRTAIPCYYPKGNSMSLMLPLCLEDDSSTDAALIVQKNPSGSYQGQTVLRLEQAYLDARLICRPNTDWLQNGVNFSN